MLTSGLPRAATGALDMASQQEGQSAMYERRVAPLRAAGISLTSAEELIKALEDERVPVQLAAAYLLKTQKVAAAVPALQRIAADSSEPPLLRLEACDALAETTPQATSWKQTCGRLLASDDQMIKLRAAGILAKSGDARGWEAVKGSLVSTQAHDVEEAAMVAHLFNGLPDSTAAGAKIAVLPVALEAFASADETSQARLLYVISKTATPADATAIARLRADAKSPYLQNSIDTIVAKLRK
jgi:HEAT repeat protein